MAALDLIVRPPGAQAKTPAYPIWQSDRPPLDQERRFSDRLVPAGR